MAIKVITVRILQYLSKSKEPARPLQIAEALHLEPITVGKELVELMKGGLAVKKDKDKNAWAITDEGTAYLKTLPPKETTPPGTGTGTERVAPVASTTTPGSGTGTEVASVASLPSTTTPPQTPAEPVSLTFPSQLDTFRSEGELLAVGSKKGEIPLDTIVKWVERMANLDDLDSIWNALTGLAIPDHIKKRWLQLYAQNLGRRHKISDELKEKIEAGPEEEKKVRTEGEVSPKPKRFSIINGEIIGDPEGDYNFNEALKLLAQQKGVAPAQADPLVSMMEAVKMGPEMATATMAAMVPLLTKETPKHDDSPWIQLLQTQLQATQNQIQTLQNMVITGQKRPETEALDTLRDSFTKQIDALKDALHQRQLDDEKKERERLQEQFVNTVARLEQRIELVGQGKTSDSKIGLLGDIVNKGFGEVSGLRSDVKSMLPTIMSRGQTVKRRTEEEKERFSQGLDKSIEETKARKEAAGRIWPELKRS